MRNALSQRTDLVAARKNIESSDINIRYFDNQSMPDLNASINYGAQAIGGVGLLRGPTGSRARSSAGREELLEDSRRGVWTGDFPGWTFSIDLTYPIGQSTTRPTSRAPSCSTCSSNGRSRSLELAVDTQVRDAARNVMTNAKRVDATRASRVLAERRLEAEEKKYQAGMTQNFFVLTAQRDLIVARNNELLALVEYAKSVVNYSAVQQTPLIGQ